MNIYPKSGNELDMKFIDSVIKEIEELKKNPNIYRSGYEEGVNLGFAEHPIINAKYGIINDIQRVKEEATELIANLTARLKRISSSDKIDELDKIVLDNLELDEMSYEDILKIANLVKQNKIKICIYNKYDGTDRLDEEDGYNVETVIMEIDRVDKK